MTVHADNNRATIFIDESNFTGEDLLAADQPVFAVASVKISAEAATDILARVIGPSQAREVKFSRLLRRNKQKILALLTEIMTEHREDIALHYIHKRFALFLKLIDCWLEPATLRVGI